MQQPVIITTRNLPPSKDDRVPRVIAESTLGFSVAFPREYTMKYGEFHREVAEALALQIALKLNTRVGELVDIDPVHGAEAPQYRFRLEF